MRPSPPLSSEASRQPDQAPSSLKSLRKMALGIVRFVVFPGLLIVLVYFFVLPWWERRKEMQLAQAAIGKADLPQAAKHLERCVQLSPKDGETSFLLARTLRRIGDLESAKTHLQRAEDLGWPLESIKLERLLGQAQAGASHPVESVLRGYLAQLPNDTAYICEALVIGYLQGNFLEDAFRWSTMWIDNVADDGLAPYWRGRVLEAGLQLDLAAEDYERATLFDRSPKDAHLRLAELLLRRLRFQEALSHFDTMLQSDPDHPAALLGVARCRRSLNEPEQARGAVEKLLTIQPEHAGGLLLLGQLELDADHNEEALPWLRKAQKLAPHDRDANQFLATALRRLNQAEEAEEYEARQGQIAKALKRLDQLTKESIDQPTNSRLRYEAGLINQELGRDQQAARWFVSALMMDPSNEEVRQALADALPKLGDARLTEYYRHLIKYRSPPGRGDNGAR